jgi:hypothetical protein
MPGRLFWAYFVGVAFFAAAIGIFTRMLARPAATMLGVMFFLFVVLLHIPRIIGNSSNGNEWTSGFVALAMCGGAWILANAAPLEEREKADPFLRLGRFLCSGFPGFRDSASRFWSFCGGTGAAVDTGTTTLGISLRRDLRCSRHRDYHWEADAFGGNTLGIDCFFVLPAALYSTHY